MNRLWGALAGAVAALALVFACSGLASAPSASGSSPSGSGHVVLADPPGNIQDTGWGTVGG